MIKAVDRVGQKYERLTVDSRADNDSRGRARWNVICDCGSKLTVLGSALASGNTKSCGCLSADTARTKATKHGHSATKSSTYGIWKTMWQRTTNPKLKAYKNYGGRGITVCDRWRDFKNFLEDMGERPDGLMIERRENDEGYSPSNCIWASRDTQNSNRRGVKRYVFEGKLLSAGQLRRLWGITRTETLKRIIEEKLIEN